MKTSAFLVIGVCCLAFQLSATTTIQSGQTLEGEISFSGEIDYYTFSAIAGDTVEIRMTAPPPSVLWPKVELRDPAGALLAQAYTGAPTEIIETLETSGTFTIVCKGYNMNAGVYTLAFLRMTGYPLHSSDTDIGGISSGETLTGEIDLAGDIDAATFSAIAGDTVEIRMTAPPPSVLWPKVELRDPAGALLAQAYTGAPTEIIETLETSGTFTIVCKGYNMDVGVYTLAFLRMTGYPLHSSDTDIGGISSGETLTGEIDLAGDIDAATFSAIAGDTVEIMMTAPPPSVLWPKVELRDPAGALLAQAYTGAPTEIIETLETSGTFTIVCKGYNMNAGVYTLAFLRMTGYPLHSSDTDIEGISSGETLTGEIDLAGDIDAATFSAIAGDTVEIRMTAPPPSVLWPKVELRDPAGALLAQAYTGAPTEIIETLETSGTFTIVCKGYNMNVGGIYDMHGSLWGKHPDDIDGDGISNKDELNAWTDPFDDSSCFIIMSMTRNPTGGPTLTWQTVGSQRYRLEYSDDHGASYSDIPRPEEEEVETDVMEGWAHWQTYTDDYSPPQSEATRELPPLSCQNHKIVVVEGRCRA